MGLPTALHNRYISSRTGQDREATLGLPGETGSRRLSIWPLARSNGALALAAYSVTIAGSRKPRDVILEPHLQQARPHSLV
jgi:hypothetical protein